MLRFIRSIELELQEMEKLVKLGFRVRFIAYIGEGKSLYEIYAKMGEEIK